MLGYNVEALAQDEGYNKGDKLKSVSCTSVSYTHLDVYKRQETLINIRLTIF